MTEYSDITAALKAMTQLLNKIEESRTEKEPVGLTRIR